MYKTILSLFSSKKGSLSSKRLAGFIGWIVCSAVLVMCTVWNRQAPDMVNTLRRHIEWAGGTCPPIVRTDI